MKQTSITRTIVESIVFLLGVFLLSIIATITHMQNNSCTDALKNRQDYVCKESNIYA